ncbi:intradiol ring-cleavage dioxygenase [Dactylosporangium sp. CA-092794]|uniref:intradiol ring-cleavage dioxygenase n=1 Tax=Dactylosporangium sp. CA-092794 TaxID=3239929 RepID=UPI003D8D563E
MADSNRRPTYEGRPLARPGAEIVDQGLGFDLGTMLDRRRLLRAFGLGATALGLAAACDDGSGAGPSGAASAPAAGDGAASAPASAGGAAAGEIPDETAGPYPGDGSNGPDVLTDSGIVRADIRSSFGTAAGAAEGVPMTLELRIVDLAAGGAPFAGVAVYVWHCDREGRYSLYSPGVTDQNYLRGVQLADGTGTVKFTSVFPGCYAGRWPHVHFEVYPDRAGLTDATKAIATSQVALPKDACDAVYARSGYSASVRNLAGVTLQSDNVFGDDGGALQLGTVTGDADRGYTVSLTARVDTRTAPTGGLGGPGGAPPGR